MSASQQADKRERNILTLKDSQHFLTPCVFHGFMNTKSGNHCKLLLHPHLSTFIQRVAKIADLAGNRRATELGCQPQSFKQKKWTGSKHMKNFNLGSSWINDPELVGFSYVVDVSMT